MTTLADYFADTPTASTPSPTQDAHLKAMYQGMLLLARTIDDNPDYAEEGLEDQIKAIEIEE